MAKFVFFSFVALFMIGATPAYAECHKRGDGVIECPEIGGSDPCKPNADGNMPAFCSAGTVSGNSSPSSKLSTTEWVMISVGVGLAVVAVAAYFWKKKPSENNPGQIALMSF